MAREKETKAEKKDPSLEKLQMLGQEMQEKLKFDPAINFDNDDYEELKEDIVKNATAKNNEGLVPGDKDKFTPGAQATLVKLGAAPWENDDEEEEDEEEGEGEEDNDSPKSDKGNKATVGDKPKVVGKRALLKDEPKKEKQAMKKEPKVKKEKEKKELSRYKHRLGTIGACIDDMVYEGVTEKAAIATIVKDFKRKASVAKGKFLSHIRHLKKDRGLNIVVDKNDKYKVKA